MKLRGVFGGTFDPVHLGHLRAAWEVAEALDMPVHMVPAGSPPHRPQPVASADQRWAMLSRALLGQDRLIADDRELKRPGPSFMFDTLTAIGEEYPGQALCLILGGDAAAALDGWHRWREVLERAHLLVLTRPGHTQAPSGPLAELLAAREVGRAEDLITRKSAAVLRFPVTAMDVSARRIRRLWGAGRSPLFLCPRAVHEYVAAHRIYSDESRAET